LQRDERGLITTEKIAIKPIDMLGKCSKSLENCCIFEPKDKLNNPAPPAPAQPELNIDELPLFPRLDIHHITLVRTGEQAEQAAAALRQTGAWGFDTESKPTFRPGEVSTGPHVLQLSSLDHAWVFQLQDPSCRRVAADLLADPTYIKAGFGLRDDVRRIQEKLGVTPQNVIDINTLFRTLGHRKEVGVKTAVALMFEQRFVKSKKAATSNWAAAALTEAQLIYAANDAYAAGHVHHALIERGMVENS
jgi:hypothetical protein